jgi:[ribosomal protein S5]-alanine N-acetyltransferase
MRISSLETERLVIREFVPEDLVALHQLLDIDLADADFGSEGAASVEARQRWLAWSVLNYGELARLYQPPYGDRAITLKTAGTLIGAIGIVPCLAPFAQLPDFYATSDISETVNDARETDVAGTASPAAPGSPVPAPSTPEVGLYYAMSSAHQRRGYTSEAAAALVRHMFQSLNLARVVATTNYNNAGSMGVMRKLGMRLLRNPHPTPPWFQVVGVLDRATGL